MKEITYVCGECGFFMVRPEYRITRFEGRISHKTYSDGAWCCGKSMKKKINGETKE